MRAGRILVGTCCCLLAIGGVAVATKSTPGERFSVRPVTSQSSPPCEAPQVEGLAAQATQCYSLGRPGVDARDVASTTVRELPGAEWVISIKLRKAALTRWGHLLEENLERPVALVVAGKVASTPTVHSVDPAGDIEITSSLDRATALVLARQITPGHRVRVRALTPEEQEQAAADAQASAICDQYAAANGFDATLGFVTLKTAGDITREARAFKLDPRGWDAFPPDHIVAQCSYGGGPVGPSTTACGKGPACIPPGLSQVAFKSVFVDQQGRATEGFTSEELKRATG